MSPGAAGAETLPADSPGSGRTLPGSVPYSPNVPETSSESQSGVTEDKPARGKDASKSHSWLRELVIMVVVALVVAFGVRTFVASSFWIPSGSMEHTLNIGDHVIVNKLGYDFHDPNRGDIVVFKAPTKWAQESGDGGDWIKRVIAVGGDRVAYDASRHKIVVNGQPINEPYIFRGPNGRQDPPSEKAFSTTVPKGRLWLMGDHRLNSSDSREHYLRSHDVMSATVPVDRVVGRAFATYWPLGRLTWFSAPDTFNKVPDHPQH